jgi:hypothetical protein
MRIIYSRASEVIVWLGNETEDSKIVMDLAGHGFKFQLAPERKGVLDPHVSHALDLFFSRPYWKRVWIIQEVVSASRLKVYCGTRSMSMQFIEGLLSNTVNRRQLLQNGDVPRFEMFRKDPKTAMPRPLVSLLFNSHASLATDPRDKVYALLCLASDGQEVVLLPSYKKPVDDVFKEVTLSILTLRYFQGILSLRPERPKTFSPSWLPDWASLTSALRSWHEWLLRPEEPRTKFDRAKGIRSQPLDIFLWPPYPEIVPDNDSILKLQGIIHDTIHSLSTRFNPEARYVSPDQQTSDVRIRPMPLETSPYHSDKMTALAIASSLCFNFVDIGIGDVSPPGTNAHGRDTISYLRHFNQLDTSTGRNSLREAHSALTRWLVENKLFDIHGRSLRRWIHKHRIENIEISVSRSIGRVFFPSTNEVSNRKRFADRLNRVVGQGMRLMVTNEGWVGMVHPHSQSGDTICTVYGCSLPLVLRKSPRGYRIIGECYVHPIDRFGDLEKWDQTLLTDIFIE